MAGRSQTGRLWPTILGAIGVALWATETTLITYTTAIPPLQMVAIAFAFAALMSPIFWWLTGTSPLAAFRQPARVWLLTVGSLAGYHGCIYYATQQAPPAAAALLQGTTPLMILLGSALLPGERLRWWHMVGTGLGLCGVVMLIENGSQAAPPGTNDAFYLSLIGAAAGLWGLYSVASRCLSEVPSSALGVFYAACAAGLACAHLLAETWIPPNRVEWAAMAALGIVPMGLAIYLWDYGVKRGDIQALGAFSYAEPFIGAVLVALLTNGVLGWDLLWSGTLVLGGALLSGASLWSTLSKFDRNSARRRLPRAAASGGRHGGRPALPENRDQQGDLLYLAEETCRIDAVEDAPPTPTQGGEREAKETSRRSQSGRGNVEGRSLKKAPRSARLGELVDELRRQGRIASGGPARASGGVLEIPPQRLAPSAGRSGEGDQRDRRDAAGYPLSAFALLNRFQRESQISCGCQRSCRFTMHAWQKRV